MSQKAELLIGRRSRKSLRRHFNEDPLATIEELRVFGLEFTTVELEAIRAIEPGSCERLARHLDPRIMKLPMGSGRPRL
jgi:hypothetical protein